MNKQQIIEELADMRLALSDQSTEEFYKGQKYSRLCFDKGKHAGKGLALNDTAQRIAKLIRKINQ